jgi:hypothetical protein
MQQEQHLVVPVVKAVNSQAIAGQDCSALPSPSPPTGSSSSRPRLPVPWVKTTYLLVIIWNVPVVKAEKNHAIAEQRPNPKISRVYGTICQS